MTKHQKKALRPVVLARGLYTVAVSRETRTCTVHVNRPALKLIGNCVIRDTSAKKELGLTRVREL